MSLNLKENKKKTFLKVENKKQDELKVNHNTSASHSALC